MIWYVHRRQDNSIASAHAEAQPGYATEALDDASNAEIQAYRATVTASPDDSTRALLLRRAAALHDSGDEVGSLEIRVGLLGG